MATTPRPLQLALKFREDYSVPVREELDQLVASINGQMPGAIAQGIAAAGGVSGGGGTASPLTTKGDLYGYGTGNQRIPVGSSGQVLMADAAATPGVSWQTPTAPPAIPVTIAQGGTGQTTKQAGFDALSPATTKGDLILYGPNGVRLPVGADGSVLTADSAQATGVRWQGPDLAMPGKYYERGRTTPIGDWINIPYSAAIFTGSGSMTWTIPSGNVTTLAYMMTGRTAFVFVNVYGVVGGTASTDLQITLPFNPTLSTPTLVRVGTGIANSWQQGFMYFQVGSSRVGIQLFAGGNIPVSANNYFVQGMGVCQV